MSYADQAIVMREYSKLYPMRHPVMKKMWNWCWAEDHSEREFEYRVATFNSVFHDCEKKGVTPEMISAALKEIQAR